MRTRKGEQRAWQDDEQEFLAVADTIKILNNSSTRPSQVSVWLEMSCCDDSKFVLLAVAVLLPLCAAAAVFGSCSVVLLVSCCELLNAVSSMSMHFPCFACAAGQDA